MHVILAHGSSDQACARGLQQLADRVADRLAAPVQEATLGERLPSKAHVLPLLLGCGAHWQRDVSAMISDADARLIAGPAEHPALMADMLQAMAMDRREKQRAVLFAMYRLISAEALMAELYRVSKRFSLPAIAALHGVCDVASVLQLWRHEGVQDVLIQPALLLPGHSLARLHELVDSSGMNVVVGEPLAACDAFADWLAECFRGNDETV